jgi:hypothetical protein
MNINTNTNRNLNNTNDIMNSNTNALANTSMDSSFSLSGNAFGNNNNSNNNNNNSIFNMNSLINANNVINDELNGSNKNTSPFMTPTAPSALSVQRSSSLLKKSLTLNVATTSTISNPFSTPITPGSPSSLNNPFNTPTSPIKPLETQLTGLSYHPPIVSSSSGMTATKSVSSWDTTTNDNFNYSSPMINTTSASMVATNLTGVQSIHSIHSSHNPFVGIH